MVPVADGVLPVSVAESDTELPTVIVVADRVVVIVTPVTGLTWRDSHGLVAPLLFESPEYDACKLLIPVALKVTVRELGTEMPATVTVDTELDAPVQVFDVVKIVYVTVPVGLNAPIKVGLSDAEPPTITDVDERIDAIAGLALFTFRDSQDDVAALLFASPE